MMRTLLRRWRGAGPTTPTNATPDGDGPNPFLAARREFASAFGDLARGKRNWQLVAVALLALLGILLPSYVRLASGPRVVPWVVEVDAMGHATAVGPADRWLPPAPRLVAVQLAAFVRDVRTVLPASAAHAQLALLQRGYAYAEPDAAGFLDRWFADPEHDPRVLGTRLSREVAVTSVLQLPRSSTWRIQWTETDYPLAPGEGTRTSAWEAFATVKLSPPTAAATLDRNPLGVWITALSWTRVGERADTNGGTS